MVKMLGRSPANVSREFLTSSLDGFVILDKDLKIVFINDSALRFFRKKPSRKEIVGRCVQDIIEAVRSEKSVREFKKGMKMKGYFVTENIVDHPKYGRLYLKVKVFQLAERYGIIISDVTEYRAMENRLAVLKNAVDHSINGVAISDLNGKLIYVNQAFLKMWKYRSLQDVLGRSAMEFWVDPSRAGDFRRCILREGSGEAEMTAVTSEGTAFNVYLMGSLIKDSAGSPVHLMACFITIDRVRELEESLSKKNLALKELFEQVGMEKERFRENIKVNIEKVLLPDISRLRTSVSRGLRSRLDSLEKNLRKIAGSYGVKISDEQVSLSPRELEVCSMVRSDCSNKQIGTALGIAVRTVETLRKSIRRKLGISQKKVNLKTYLNRL